MLTITLQTERIKEPNNALKKPSTCNPGVIHPASIKSNAFITRLNSPTVKIFIGSEINFITGLTNTLIMAMTTQASIALQKFATDIPGISQAVKIIARA